MISEKYERDGKNRPLKKQNKCKQPHKNIRPLGTTYLKIRKKFRQNTCLKMLKKFIIHEINSLVIFKMTAHYEVINKESLVVKFFDTEEESLNYCLDRFAGSQKTKQLYI
jgi:hypothetical protein